MKTQKNNGPLALLFILLAMISLAVLAGQTGPSAAEVKSGNNNDQTSNRFHEEVAQDKNMASPDSTPVALPLKGKTIVVDPGHGGKAPGATRILYQAGSPPAASGGNPSSANRRKGEIVYEKDLTLKIALELKRELEAKGATVVMTRTTDTTVSLDDRVKLANSVKPDLFVSVHINAHTRSTVDGIETYYWTAQSECPARFIFDALVDELKEPGNWVQARQFYVVHHTAAPSVLAEVGYMSHTDTLKKLVTPQYQKRIATAIASGVVSYFSQTCTVDRGSAIMLRMPGAPGDFTPGATPTPEPDACELDHDHEKDD